MRKDKMTFLQSSYRGKRLGKRIDKDGRSHQIKGAGSASLDSIVKTVEMDSDGLEMKCKLVKAFAKKGGALLKGHLIREIESESRKGLTDREASTNTIVFDFDDVRLDDVILPPKPCKATIEIIAERLIAELPPCFHNASYIAQASSSFGMKANGYTKQNIHIDFWLEEPIHPNILAEYLTFLNFDIEYFKEKLYLNGTGTHIHKQIDDCMYQNSRMIYIGYPDFEDAAMNPFADDNERVIIVHKKNLTVNLTTQLMLVNSEKLKADKVQIEKALHKKRGTTYRKPSFSRLHLAAGPVSVITNPGLTTFAMYEDYGSYIAFNVGNSTNNAYYVVKEEPNVVRNFKKEPWFLMSEANPEYYEWFTETYLESDQSKKTDDDGNKIPSRLRPILYLERVSDQFHYGLYDIEKNQLTSMYTTTHLKQMESWFEQKGEVAPKDTLFIRHEFIPDDPRTVDLKDGFVNTFKPADYFSDPIEINEEYCDATIKTAADTLKELCPISYQCIRHAVGSQEEVGYFLNWLAYIFQKRQKTGTAFILHGVQGTGKGLIFDKLLRPILQEAAQRISVDMLDEKFNGYVASSLLILLDEYRHTDSANGSKTNNKIKALITEPTSEVRMMRRDVMTIPSYSSVLIYSNHNDSALVEYTDRRFHVPPRQEIPILVIYPDWKERVPEMEKERKAFCAFLLAIELDEYAATTPRMTEAKEELRQNSMRTQDIFAEAIMQGDLMYFAEVLHVTGNLTQMEYIGAAQKLFKAWVRDYKPDTPVKVFNNELRSLYEVLIGHSGSPEKFGKQLSHLNIKSKAINRNGQRSRGLEVTWKMSDIDRQQLMNSFNGQDYSQEPTEKRAMP